MSDWMGMLSGLCRLWQAGEVVRLITSPGDEHPPHTPLAAFIDAGDFRALVAQLQQSWQAAFAEAESFRQVSSMLALLQAHIIMTDLWWYHAAASSTRRPHMCLLSDAEHWSSATLHAKVLPKRHACFDLAFDVSGDQTLKKFHQLSFTPLLHPVNLISIGHAVFCSRMRRLRTCFGATTVSMHQLWQLPMLKASKLSCCPLRMHWRLDRLNLLVRALLSQTATPPLLLLPLRMQTSRCLVLPSVSKPLRISWTISDHS